MNKQDPYNMMSKSFYGGAANKTRAVTSQMSNYNEQVTDRHTLSQSMIEVSNIASD